MPRRYSGLASTQVGSAARRLAWKSFSRGGLQEAPFRGRRDGCRLASHQANPPTSHPSLLKSVHHGTTAATEEPDPLSDKARDGPAPTSRTPLTRDVNSECHGRAAVEPMAGRHWSERRPRPCNPSTGAERWTTASIACRKRSPSRVTGHPARGISEFVQGIPERRQGMSESFQGIPERSSPGLLSHRRRRPRGGLPYVSIPQDHNDRGGKVGSRARQCDLVRLEKRRDRSSTLAAVSLLASDGSPSPADLTPFPYGRAAALPIDVRRPSTAAFNLVAPCRPRSAATPSDVRARPGGRLPLS